MVDTTVGKTFAASQNIHIAEMENVDPRFQQYKLTYPMRGVELYMTPGDFNELMDVLTAFQNRNDKRTVESLDEIPF